MPNGHHPRRKSEKARCISSTATMADDSRAEPLRSDSPVQLVMVNVTAPATLPAGYEFEAQVEGGDPEETVHAIVVCAYFSVSLDTAMKSSSHLLFRYTVA